MISSQAALQIETRPIYLYGSSGIRGIALAPRTIIQRVGVSLGTRLKAHLVKTSYNERFQPSKTWNGGRLSLEVLFIVHAGDSAVTTVTMESYMLLLFPQFFMHSGCCV